MSNTLQMKCPSRAVVNAGDFANALKKVSPILKRSVIPVLEEVCVRFSNGQCILTATDLTTWITAEIPAEGDDFSFVFSRTKDVGRVCRNVSGKIVIELNETATEKYSHPVVTMTCGSRAAEFDAYSAKDFPTTPVLKETPAFSVNAADLLERINKVAYATEKVSTEAREIRSCVQFAGKRIYALDGMRAAWDEGDMNFTQPFMVRADMLRYLKVFGASQVDFIFSRPHLSVTDGTTTVIFRMTESEPYNLARAIPQKYLEELSVSPKEFLCELKYLSDVIPTTNKPYVYLRGTELFMSVSGKRFSTSVDIHRTSDMTVGLNLYYLTDALKQFAAEKRVTVKISGVYSPVVIEAKGRSDRALILPVRVSADAAA